MPSECGSAEKWRSHRTLGYQDQRAAGPKQTPESRLRNRPAGAIPIVPQQAQSPFGPHTVIRSDDDGAIALSVRLRMDPVV
jgi:hypothetical protein